MPDQVTAEVMKDQPAKVSALGVGKTPAVPQPAIADIGAAPTAAQYNALLAVLRTFGLILT